MLDKSHRPHSHPNEHTEEEYKLIERYYRRNKDDMIVLWDKLRKEGYTRCYKSMLRAIKRLGLCETPEKRKGYNPKPYQRAEYPGQKVQIDVKYVPSRCVATPRHNGKVERQHRMDGVRFYSKTRMYSLEDGRKQIARYNRSSNNIPKCCLNFRSPQEVLEDYLAVM